MRTLLVVLILAIAACTPGVSDPGPKSLSTSTTGLPLITTTSAAPLAFEIDTCATPQVTFSPLCETYKIIQEWHVDRPVDPAALATAALTGLDGFSTEETENPPRTILCAVPDAAFAEFCSTLTKRVAATSLPIGPAVEAAVLAMTDLGLDPFSYYLPPEKVGAFRLNGIVGGVGVVLDATDASGSKCVLISGVCPLRVVYVIPDGPGDVAGMTVDDVITAVDGSPVDGLGFVDTATRIAGDETGNVVIRIDRGGSTLEFDIVRAEVGAPPVELALPQKGIGYIRIPDFEDDIPALVAEALDTLLDEPLNTIVIDLRDNGGGFLDAAIDVMSEFVDDEIVLLTVDAGESLEYRATAGGVATGQRLIVLVNEGTASSAEITAAALRDTRDATLVGTPTFGKDAVQIAFELRNGGEFYIAVSRWLSPREVSVGQTGLVPDYELELPPELSAEALVELALEGTR